MFIIRREQLELLQRQLVEAFERSAIRRVRKTFPKQTANSTDDHLRLMVRDAIDRAEKYGIRGEAEVTAYLEFMVSYGREFDGDPSLKRILRVRNISGTEKLNRLALIKPLQYEDSAE